MLIVSILMAIAVPLYLTAVADAEVKTARANMQTIADAVQAYKVRFQIYTASFQDLSGDLGNSTGPVGPGTRTYSINLNGSGCTDDEGTLEPGTPAFTVTDNVPGDGVFCLGISPN
jgi:type IV pilus assembly protein PilA